MISFKVTILTLVALQVRGQKPVFSEEDIQCLRENGTVYHARARRCQPLLERGICPQDQWLVLQPSHNDYATVEAVCKPCPCCKETTRKIYWPVDEKCHKSSDPSICSAGSHLSIDFDGNGVCQCSDGFAKVRGSEECHAFYQYYNRCRQGEYLVPASEGWAQCAKNPCPREKMALWNDGECYQLDTRGPCNESDELFRIDTFGTLKCVSNAFSSIQVPTRCREPCIIRFGNTGSKPQVSNKLQAHLNRLRIQISETTSPPKNPANGDIWIWS